MKRKGRQARPWLPDTLEVVSVSVLCHAATDSSGVPCSYGVGFSPLHSVLAPFFEHVGSSCILLSVT